MSESERLLSTLQEWQANNPPKPAPLPPHWTEGRKTTVSKDRGALFANLITDEMIADATMRRGE